MQSFARIDLIKSVSDGTFAPELKNTAETPKGLGFDEILLNQLKDMPGGNPATPREPESTPPLLDAARALKNDITAPEERPHDAVRGPERPAGEKEKQASARENAESPVPRDNIGDTRMEKETALRPNVIRDANGNHDREIHEKDRPSAKELRAALDPLRMLLGLLKIIPEESKEVHKLKNAMQEFNDYLQGRGGGARGGRELENLLSRLKSLLDKISGEGKEGENTNRQRPDAPGIKEEAKNFLEILNRLSRKNDKSAPVNGDSELKDTKNGSGRMDLSITVDKGQRKEGAAPRNNDSSFNFQSYRGGENAVKQNPAAPHVIRNNAFSEQLQSIIQNARIVVKDGNSGSFSMRLFPESLGRVNVNLGLDQGVLTGRFLVDTQEAKNLLLENISSLMEQLEESGIEVGGFQVDVRDSEKSFYENPDGPRSGRNTPVLAALSGRFEENSVPLHDGMLDMII
jgi:hypothetical protein